MKLSAEFPQRTNGQRDAPDVSAVTQINLHPPSEGVHFGFDEDVHFNLIKRLRRWAKDSGGPIGSEIMTGNPQGVAYRDTATRILDIEALAASFAGSFKLAAQTFTSTEFALQMIAGVDQVSFVLS